MVSHHQRYPVKIVLTSAHLAHRIIAAKKILRRNFANGQNNFRLHKRDLALQIGPTSRSLNRFGVSIVGWSTFEDIRNKYGIPALTDRSQHLVQHFSSTTHEWFTATVFLGSRRFADNHPVGILIADTKDSLSTAVCQLAALAIRDASTQFVPIQILRNYTVTAFRLWLVKLGSIARQPDIDTHSL
jgi:hypothetical protein